MKIEKTEAQWKALLAEKGAEPLAYQVTRKEGTERAFTGRYESNKADGTYLCVCCDKPLFDASTKYESGSGWPSFFQPLSEDAVATQEDRSLWLGAHRGALPGLRRPPGPCVPGRPPPHRPALLHQLGLPGVPAAPRHPLIPA